MKTKLRLVLSIPLFFACFYGTSQDLQGIWQRADRASGELTLSGEKVRNTGGQAFMMRAERLEAALKPLQQGQASIVLSFPDASGTLKRYQIEERSVLAPALQEKYPGIRSYVGREIEGSEHRIRFSLTHKGFQGIIHKVGSNSAAFIEKSGTQPDKYILFKREDLEMQMESWKCETLPLLEKSSPDFFTAKLADDQTLRRYRLAVATTGEYTQFHGGTVPDALAAIAATLTRINEVFERDLAINLELVANNDQVIYTDPASDPFGGNFSAEVQTTLNTVIGSAQYDIGHLFHQGSEAGNAGFVGAVCQDNRKGSAFAATPSPQGDRFDLDFVAHEMGHQFGANHTWSFDSEGTGVQAEPASGTTIMGYAGIAQGNNVQPAGDDYFHYYSISQIFQYIAGTSCATEVPLSNSPPQITPLPDYHIPQGTAFVLEGLVSDPDPSDVLTYAWEQVDDGLVTTASFGPENPSGANFRSLPPELTPGRYFPRLERVAGGNLTQEDPPINSAWETVSTIARDLNFALTVRDNAVGGGQVVSDLVRVSVEADRGPFTVLSQASPQTYAAGSVQTISWDVAGTTDAPVNAQQVDIYYSDDGGLDFSTLRAAGLPNNGTATVQVPAGASTQGRFMVKARDQIFFAVNATNFTIEEQAFVLDFQELGQSVCQPDNAQYSLTFNTFGGFNEEVTLSTEGLPAGLSATFSNNTVQANGTVISLTISNTAALPPGLYPFTVNGTNGSISADIPLELQISSGSFSDVVLTAPADNSLDVGLRPAFSWQASDNADAYELQLATDAAFSNIVADQVVYGTSYSPQTLQPDTDYFWRLKAINSCGEGAFGSAFTFRTISTECRTLAAQGLPLTISASGTPTVESTVTFIDDLPVTSVSLDMDLAHSFLSDLVITLISPSGTEVTLIANSCGQANDINATFEQGAAPFVCANNPAISGTVRPLGSLDSFRGESSLGTWTLRIDDTIPADGGQLNGFSLQLCVEGAFRPDADGDGVFDDGDDLCLGTPPGTEVDADGCPVYRFAPDQFEISTTAETCTGANDGTILVQASEPLDYNIRILGPGTNVDETFTSVFEQLALAPGTYQLCIDGTDGSIVYEEYCVDVVIQPPAFFEVTALQSPDSKTVELSLSGSDSYLIRLNGQEQIVSGPAVTLQLPDGINTLEVEGIPVCRGTFQATFLTGSKISALENPVTDVLGIFITRADTQVDIKVFDTAGALLLMRDLQPSGNTVQISLGGLPTGLYFVQVENGNQKRVLKILKR
ncbi:reprolysin-like metallopeptidase [Robiginitalea sp. IMCC44478]|uniref:reprolysin-like metallopeptidase n=1 Tax=Robiginitalea sp. IMCC44478 TaxID=3459122 RepID=UPI0040423A8B